MSILEYYRNANITYGGGTIPFVTSTPSDSFVDSTANASAKMYYTSGTYSDTNSVITAMNYVGLRGIRDRVKTGTNNPNVTKQASAWASIRDSHIKINAIVGVANETSATTTQAFQNLNNYIGTYGMPIISLEGANEWNMNTSGGGYSGWEVDDLNYQTTIWNATQSGSGYTYLQNMPVIAGSMGGVTQANYQTQGDYSAICTYGNLHSYPGGYQPQGPRLNNSPATAWKFDYGLGFAQTYVVPNAGSPKQVILTESGYHNYTPQTTGNLGIDLEPAGIYGPRRCAEAFLRFPRSYFYEFVDDTIQTTTYEQHFGLVDSSFNYKPIATTLRILFSLLSDRDPYYAPYNFVPLGLAYALTNVPNTVTVQTILLENHNGHRFLLIWRNDNDSTIYTPAAGGGSSRTPTYNPTITVNLALPFNVKLYDPYWCYQQGQTSPMVGTSFNDQSTYTSTTSFTVTMGANLIVAEIY